MIAQICHLSETILDMVLMSELVLHNVQLVCLAIRKQAISHAVELLSCKATISQVKLTFALLHWFRDVEVRLWSQVKKAVMHPLVRTECRHGPALGLLQAKV